MKKILCVLMLIVIVLVCFIGCENKIGAVSEEGEYMSSDGSYVLKFSGGVASFMEDGYYVKMGSYKYSEGEIRISTPNGVMIGSLSENGEHLTIIFPDGTGDSCKKLSSPTGK